MSGLKHRIRVSRHGRRELKIRLLRCEKKNVTKGVMPSDEFVDCCLLDPCDYVTCEYPEICRLDYERRASCVCSEFCNEDFIPVCGSDGRTYTNECFIRRQACRMMPDLRIVSQGQCDQGKYNKHVFLRSCANVFVSNTVFVVQPFIQCRQCS